MINQDILNVVVQEIELTSADELEKRLQQSEQSIFAQSINELSAFSKSSLRDKKLTRAGGLAQYANPELIPLEDQAVTMALKVKYANHQK
ncbi:hypothetical protein B8W92_05650 [Moraxella osloensis]|nr:hypothetical protein [Moraxella osloensis]PAL16176.1 hypothetical protein B8W92_05650 [Moraxella osloensis]